MRGHLALPEKVEQSVCFFLTKGAQIIIRNMIEPFVNREFRMDLRIVFLVWNFVQNLKLYYKNSFCQDFYRKLSSR